MRDYQKIACVIVHDASDPNSTRYGAYFENYDGAKSYRDDLELNNPGFWAYDLFDFRWFGWNKKAILETMNSAYYQFFNYQLFVEGYDGLAAEDTPGRGLVIFTESPRKLGFNCFTERPRRRKR
jgi:hypothetical protein